MKSLINIIIYFGIPFVVLLFVKNVYIKPVPKLEKVKQYLLFEKTVIKRITPVPIKQTNILVCLYIFIWQNLTFGYQIFWDEGGGVYDLIIWLGINVIWRAICELFLVIIPNHKYKRQMGAEVKNMQMMHVGAEMIQQPVVISTPAGETVGFCFCGECGTKYAENAALCPNCGYKNVQQIMNEQSAQVQADTDEGRINEKL